MRDGRRRPARGRAVGALWEPGHIDPAAIVAWEHGVGDGGILCLGAPVQLDPADPSRLPALHRLLENAVMGDAILSKSRARPAATWGDPRAAARFDPALELPRRTPLPSPIPDTVQTSLQGRRIRVVLGEGSGGTAPRLETPGLVLLRDLTGSHTAGAKLPHARWLVAHELPAAVAAFTGDHEVELEWLVDLARGVPVAGPGRAELRGNVSDDGTCALVVAEDGAAACFEVSSGRLRLEPAGATLRVRCSGPERVGLSVIGAEGPDDLHRTLRLLERDGWLGALAKGEAHEARLLATALTLDVPDGRLRDAVRASLVGADRRITELGEFGRLPTDDADGYVSTLARACAAAEALLAFGSRAAARDLLRAAATREERLGGLPDRVFGSGYAERLDGAGTRALAHLARRYRAWTGGLPDGAARLLAHEASDSADLTDPALTALADLWQVEPDAPNEAVALSPRLPDGWRRTGLARLRVGATTLDAECRLRPSGLVVRLRRISGASLTARVGQRQAKEASLAVDEVALGGAEAIFVLEGEHDVEFRF